MRPGRRRGRGESRAAALLIFAALTAAIAAPGASAAGYLPVIEQAPGFALVAQNGLTVNSSELRGSVVLLAFMYTHCASVCPIVTDRMEAIAQGLKSRGVLGEGLRMVSISFDPARDSPGWLATYARSIGADPRWWLFLTGSREQVADLLERYDFHVTRLPTGDFDHVSRIYLIDASGSVRQIYSVSFLDPSRVERDVNSLLAERRQAHWVRSQ